MSGHRVHADLFDGVTAGMATTLDPGNGLTINLARNFTVCPLTIAASASETRLLPDPVNAGLKAGLTLTVVANQIGASGVCVIEGLTFNTEGQSATWQTMLVNDIVDWVLLGSSSNVSSIGEFNLLVDGVSLLAIDDSAIVGNQAAATVAGKSVFAETQDGGSDGGSTNGRAAGNFTFTAGVASGSTDDGNGADSGSISFVTQAGTALSGAGSVNGKAGVIRLNAAAGSGGVFKKQAAPTAETATSQTYTAAELMGGIITSTQTGAVTGTLDVGSNMDLAVSGQVGTDESFEWTLVNLGSASGAVTVTPSSGHTCVGLMTVAISTSGTFITRRTAANTWVTYRK